MGNLDLQLQLVSEVVVGVGVQSCGIEPLACGVSRTLGSRCHNESIGYPTGVWRTGELLRIEKKGGVIFVCLFFLLDCRNKILQTA